jgi:5'(3')-deoxyribonucleotidase
MEKALFRYFPYLGNRDLIIMRDKQMIKCDFLVDDAIHNIVGDYKGLLVDMPSNQGFSHPNVIRVFDFQAVYDIINQAAEEE